MPQLLFRDLPLLDDIQLNKYITILTDLQVADPDLSVKITAGTSRAAALVTAQPSGEKGANVPLQLFANDIFAAF